MILCVNNTLYVYTTIEKLEKIESQVLKRAS